MPDIHIYTVSNDRYYAAGLHALLRHGETLAHDKIALHELPFEKETFETHTLLELKNNACDFLVLDCSCGFINYYGACSALYSALEQGTLNAKIILLYENSLCLTNPDMYNHFITLDKNARVEDILLSMFPVTTMPDESDSEETETTIRQYLTCRELIIINEIYSGALPCEIAKKLKLRLKTINCYKNRAMKKISSKRPQYLHP
ncbi:MULTISPECIES: LuxR C-terminal-related transcriptional regulator [unclassified Serratia (in: enterobacteria)]|uniref:LuxR C-terminal-related transcriptional regulator n=1 Tax=unclassified Serratia (in: enterobacteria) TaxID=2647522 RepID=UPI0004691287|nr:MULTISPECIES: LuxR C-terminal-related transcriptional regulator [unclassified Serratia (in: enterobacteria)]